MLSIFGPAPYPYTADRHSRSDLVPEVKMPKETVSAKGKEGAETQIVAGKV